MSNTPLAPAAAWPFPPVAPVDAAPATPERAASEATDSDPFFVTVPETTLPDGRVVRAFKVGKYMASRSTDGKVVFAANGAPWTEISYHDARKACADAGYQLLTESQALAIAVNIAGVAANWTGGAVGEGKLLQGLHLDLDDVSQPYPNDFVSRDEREKRVFTLSNGETIYDAAGNAYSWIFDDIQGDENGVVAGGFVAGSPSISSAPYPSMEKGMGWYPSAGTDWSGRVLVRGGYGYSGGHAGVFSLDRVWPDYGGGYVGFRCTKGL